MNDNFTKPANMDDRIKKSQEVYDNLNSEFIKNNNGKYIAVDTDSGDYFVGETREEAVSKANTDHPEKIVFVRRIGDIEKVAYNSPLNFNNNYACLF